MASDKFSTTLIKIKLYHNPSSVTDIEKYTEEFCVWNGSSIKEFFQTQSDLKEIIMQLLIRNKSEL